MRAGPSQPEIRPALTIRRSQDRSLARRLFNSRRGASAVEYALLVALIGVAILAATMGLGTSVRNTFNNAEAAQKSGDSFNVL